MKLAVVMDPIERIKPHKDSTLAMLLAAQKRDLTLYYLEPQDLYLEKARAHGLACSLKVMDDADCWYELGPQQVMDLGQMDLVLMRQDPPVTMEYHVATYILEHAQEQGALVVNDPSALRDVNEKAYCTWFPELMAPTLISKDSTTLRGFLNQHGDIIVKPLHSMGGDSVFRITQGDLNTSAIFESVSENFHQFVMAQAYIPEIRVGDKRILLIDGEPVPYALARIPAAGETRGNLAAGGQGVGVELSERDLEICRTVGPHLKERGLLFVGLDVIGDYLTEINVTSPTCIRELDREYGLDIAGDFIDCLQHYVNQAD